MNNNSSKSVSDFATKSKKPQRKSRQDGYRKKFGNRPHMIIPQEDSEFIETQTASVMKLWLQCWRSDPYGSQEMQLNHSLTYKSFMRAKKVIEEAGMFTFRPEKSKINHKETICWKIQNLHGARRNDFWLKSQGQQSPSQGQQSLSQGQHCPSDNSEAQSQQAIQNPSESSQERLSNSYKELLETLVVDPWVDECGSDTALEERVTSASSGEKKRGQQPKNTGQNEQSETNPSSDCEFSETDNVPRAVVQKSSNNVLDREYIPNPYSPDAVVRANAQNLAIEAEMKTETYQRLSKEFYARFRTFKEQLEKNKKDDRDRRLRGDDRVNPA